MDWWAGDLKDKWHFLTQFSNGKKRFLKEKKWAKSKYLLAVDNSTFFYAKMKNEETVY
jgi:hypothetical protein